MRVAFQLVKVYTITKQERQCQCSRKREQTYE